MADERLDGSEFQDLHDRFTAAFENEDNDALARFYAPTAVMINPAGNVLASRDAIITFLQRAQRIQSVRFAASDTRRVAEGMVRQVGALTLTVRGQGRETQSVAGSFFVLWSKRGADWQIDSCVWSRRPQDQGARAGGRGMAGGGMGGGGRMGGGGMGGGGMGGRRMAGPVGRGRGAGGREAPPDEADRSSDAGEGGAALRRGRQAGREGGGGFSPRNINRDDDAPLIPRLE